MKAIVRSLHVGLDCDSFMVPYDTLKLDIARRKCLDAPELQLT